MLLYTDKKFTFWPIFRHFENGLFGTMPTQSELTAQELKLLDEGRC